MPYIQLKLTGVLIKTTKVKVTANRKRLTENEIIKIKRTKNRKTKEKI